MWDCVSEGAKDAVRRMMSWHPNRRPSAREMMSNAWIATTGLPSPPPQRQQQQQQQQQSDALEASNSSGDEMSYGASATTSRSSSMSGCSMHCSYASDAPQCEHEIVRRMRKFAALEEQHRLAALAAASCLPRDRVAGLRQLFGSMANGGRGAVGAQELVAGLAQRCVLVEKSDAERFIAAAVSLVWRLGSLTQKQSFTV